MRPPAFLPPLIALCLIACATSTSSPLATPFPTLPPVAGPRPFAMGISSLPPDLTEESYAATFGLAGALGEVVLVQRRPPWRDLLDGRISEATARTTQREKELADAHGLDLFVAIDPTDSSEGRSRLVDLPDDLAGAGFANEEIRRAFLTYAQYVAENYRPQYLALGVEINAYQHEHPQDFEQFVTLYHEAYRAVKELSPDTLVFPTFQYEEIQGLLPLDRPYPPQWYLINRFQSAIDMLAVSSYPSLAFASAADVPAGYYTQLLAYTRGAIGLTGIGFSSESHSGADENGQATFLQNALDNAAQLDMSLVVWFAGQDPSFTSDAPFDELAHIGLRRQDGSEKPAFLVWVSTLARRPVQSTPTPEG